jgi:hypothetical protein
MWVMAPNVDYTPLVINLDNVAILQQQDDDITIVILRDGSSHRIRLPLSDLVVRIGGSTEYKLL